MQLCKKNSTGDICYSNNVNIKAAADACVLIPISNSCCHIMQSAGCCHKLLDVGGMQTVTPTVESTVPVMSRY